MKFRIFITLLGVGVVVLSIVAILRNPKNYTTITEPATTSTATTIAPTTTGTTTSHETTTTLIKGFVVSTSTTLDVDGFKIKYPPRPLPAVVLYTIQPGDTLTSIAAKFDQEGWGALFVQNWVKSVGDGGIVDPNEIYAGRVIQIVTVEGISTMTMVAPVAPVTTTTT